MSLGSYFFGIVTFSVVINLIGMLYPNDKSGVRQALDICLSLCLLCAVIAPIGGMVARAKGEISLDATGKRAGRGAYLCKSAECLRRARKSRRIEQSLETVIGDEIYAALEEELARV